VLRVIPDRNRLGRDAEAELSLPDDGVSRLHAEILLFGASYALKDLGSRNGTYLNGIRVGSTGTLSHGDEVRLGATVLLFFADDEDPAVMNVASVRGGETRSLGGEAPVERPLETRRARFHYMIGESEAL